MKHWWWVRRVPLLREQGQTGAKEVSQMIFTEEILSEQACLYKCSFCT